MFHFLRSHLSFRISIFSYFGWFSQTVLFSFSALFLALQSLVRYFPPNHSFSLCHELAILHVHCVCLRAVAHSCYTNWWILETGLGEHFSGFLAMYSP